MVAYARVVPPGLSYKTPAIGRVVVDTKYRGKKYGYVLMDTCIKDVLKRYKTNKITISAQLYLKQFYTNAGFHAMGQVYPEDDIPHIKMVYTVK
ncbi:MAG TPA: GNAT family N-acetyltransferase, partial [Bacteroidia bacterium]|nr:GNAT family N-acetyltransferase [Bacteroidia bacterium]